MTRHEKKIRTTDISLDESSPELKLIATTTTVTYTASGHTTSSESETFPLMETTRTEIWQYRKLKIPTLILKVGDALYLSVIPKDNNFNFRQIIPEHRCAVSGHECRRLSALDDKHGGCEKVRNCARFIERYHWIRWGIETFGTSSDVFIVEDCEHYEKCPPRRIHTPDEIKKSKKNLAELFWDEKFNDEFQE